MTKFTSRFKVWLPGGRPFDRWEFIATCAATWLVFLVGEGQWIPDVNESHYLTKARNFWNPAWCANDLFLKSHSPHWAFFFSFCWPLTFLPIDWFVWIGRFLVWGIAATGFVRWLSNIGIAAWMIPFLAMLWLLLIDLGNMAGEWVIGGLEAKSLAYALILHALASWTTGCYRRSGMELGLASLLHVLVAGWVWLALAMAYMSTLFLVPAARGLALARLSPNREIVQAGLLVGLFMAVAIAPTLLNDLFLPDDITRQAAQIQVLQRLSHHLFFPAFETTRVASFIVLVGLQLVLSAVFPVPHSLSFWNRWTWASLVIGAGGLILSASVESNPDSRWAMSLLRLYWFRLADFAVPTLVTLQIGVLVSGRHVTSFLPRGFLITGLSLLAIAFSLRGFEHCWQRIPPADRASLTTYPQQPARTVQTYENWRRVCDWIRKNTPQDAVFITPADQQTFKWYAERAEVVCWKDMPQDARSLVEWWQRVQQLTLFERNHPGQGLAAYSEEYLQELGRAWGADYLVMPQGDWETMPRARHLQLLYPTTPGQKTTYVVVKL